MKTTLTLVRHGQSYWNASRRWQGHAPIPLDEIGLQQAEYLASAVAKDGGVDVIYSSDLKRSRQTAEAIGRAVGLDIRCDPLFREIHVGEWQGLTVDEVVAFDGERYKAHVADRWNVPIPGGESDRTFRERVIAGLDRVLQEHRGQHIVVVTHGGTIHTILRHFQLHPDGNLLIGNTSRTVLRLDEQGAAEAAFLCDISHLPVNTPEAAAGEANAK